MYNDLCVHWYQIYWLYCTDVLYRVQITKIYASYVADSCKNQLVCSERIQIVQRFLDILKIEWLIGHWCCCYDLLSAFIYFGEPVFSRSCSLSWIICHYMSLSSCSFQFYFHHSFFILIIFIHFHPSHWTFSIATPWEQFLRSQVLVPESLSGKNHGVWRGSGWKRLENCILAFHQRIHALSALNLLVPGIFCCMYTLTTQYIYNYWFDSKFNGTGMVQNKKIWIKRNFSASHT